MSAPILKSYVDESGNISVRISEDVLVLTCEEAECIEAEYKRIQAENAKLREMARNLHMAYVETLNECESLNEGLICEYSGNVKADVAKSSAKFEVLRHRFDDALRELGVEVDR